MADLEERSDSHDPGGSASAEAAREAPPALELVPEPAPEAALPAPAAGAADPETMREFSLERYRYILQQIHTLNENVYRFLALYQALATAVVGAALALFVGYESWGLEPATARAGMVALMWLNTVIAGFSVMLIIIGVIAWLDYRREECELTDEIVRPGFRKRPQVRNLFRWYETYIVAFIVTATVFAWVGTVQLLLPTVK
ncbi:hypothetical protein [Streptomyces sp. SP18CS02]|uniref:hypothetical protein n=1 Tax=Streptomyces sp. SP18CS02 TaxID=3002531 RepID=UPI002E795856|nr:hypothetical protein [Streptomyces sp. SP18CS02]MEE1754581.1 hypothetical protein [Streptomyces sp. SP18CS02]